MGSHVIPRTILRHKSRLITKTLTRGSVRGQGAQMGTRCSSGFRKSPESGDVAARLCVCSCVCVYARTRVKVWGGAGANRSGSLFGSEKWQAKH